MMPMGGMGGSELVIIVLILVLVGAYLYTRRTMEDSSGGSTSAGPIRIDWDAVNNELLRDSILRGRKIEAIKRYRELTGAGLKEAKAAIEYLIAHPDEKDPRKKRPPELSDAGLRDLLARGQFDRAIEVYREFAGVDYYTAQAAVRRMGQEMGLDVDETEEDGVSLDELMTRKGHLAAEGSDLVYDEHVLNYIELGRRQEAIQKYREITGVEWQDAKDAVDELKRRMDEE